MKLKWGMKICDDPTKTMTKGARKEKIVEKKRKRDGSWRSLKWGRPCKLEMRVYGYTIALLFSISSFLFLPFRMQIRLQHWLFFLTFNFYAYLYWRSINKCNQTNLFLLQIVYPLSQTPNLGFIRALLLTLRLFHSLRFLLFFFFSFSLFFSH